MQLNVVQVNSKHFTHFPKTKSLVAEISDIGVRNFQPLYDDACDVGFALRNPETGNVTRWYMAEEVRLEGELQAWVLKPCSESLHRNPKLAGYQIRLLND